jgi:hypothetical protein
MKMIAVIFVACPATFLSLCLNNICFAGGLENHNIGLRGVAMGYAMAGLGDDASAVYYNPGGLVSG